MQPFFGSWRHGTHLRAPTLYRDLDFAQQ
jgi:hypothetical protein